MYLLRTITKNKSGKFLGDNWYIFEDESDMIKKIISLKAKNYQCFNAQDITSESFLNVENTIEMMEKQKRREAYEKLKLEFEEK